MRRDTTRRIRVLPTLFILAVCAAAGCVPPHGLAPIPVPDGRHSVGAFGRLRGGLSEHRQVLEVEGVVAGRISKWFSMGGGVRYTAVHAPRVYLDQHDAADFKHSGTPYVRPILHLGPVSVEGSFALLPLVGPEAGILYGLGGLTVAYSQPSWGVHLGSLGHYFMSLNQDGEEEASGWQTYGGGYWHFHLDGFIVGLAGQLIYGDNDYDGRGQGDTSQRFWMGVLSLEFGYAGD